MTPNSYNYIRVSALEPVSIESLGILLAVGYLLYLLYRRQASLEILYFLALPFSDDPFRLGPLQPIELIGFVLVVLNYRQIRLNYVLLMGGVFVLFSLIGSVTGNVVTSYSLLYSFRFVLIGLLFSIFLKRPFTLPVSVMRFAVAFSFTLTVLQVSLWLAGLPIHGIFFNGIIPRPKGLAHEPATWAIWIVTLFPYILHFKLGRMYLWMNLVMLALTFSTFGIVSTLSFFLIRWIFSGAKFRLTRSFVQTIGATVGLLLLLVVLKPDLLASVSKFAAVFDKLVAYQQQFVAFTRGDSVLQSGVGLATDESGRGRDLNYFQLIFPDHWLVGIGSFNAPYNGPVDGGPDIAGTNSYLITPVEVGASGSLLLLLLFGLHYHMLWRHRKHMSIEFLAYSLNFVLMIAGIRIISFYDPWYTQAAALRLAHDAETENKVENRDIDASADHLAVV